MTRHSPPVKDGDDARMHLPFHDGTIHAPFNIHREGAALRVLAKFYRTSPLCAAGLPTTTVVAQAANVQSPQP